MNEVMFPQERDVYASGEIASIYFKIPIGDVGMIHMRRAALALIEQGVIKAIKMRNGNSSLFPWPGARRCYGLYSVRNHERYADPDNAVAHLVGVPPPGDTNLSYRKRESIARKRREDLLKYRNKRPGTQ